MKPMYKSQAAAAAASSEMKPFVYQAVQGPVLAAGANDAKAKPQALTQPFPGSLQQPETKEQKYTQEEVQAQLQVQLEAQKKQAWEQGARDSENRLRPQHDAALAAERKRINEVLEEFARERKSYFERVEGEVVQLALAIARKILHREAQIDPLFLTGIVRVALEKVAATSSVKLRVSENDVFKWRQIVAALKGVQPQPEVVGDPTLPNGRCIMETDVGSTQISLDTQFREVERGLLDLLALRPAS